MKKSDFLRIKKKYNEERARLQRIKRGDLVWEAVHRGGWDIDYHPAVVKEVNVDEDYIDVIDVSYDNKEKKYTYFMTKSELIQKAGFSKESIKEEYKKYRGIIKKLLK
jgi:hypothetical protein